MEILLVLDGRRDWRLGTLGTAEPGWDSLHLEQYYCDIFIAACTGRLLSPMLPISLPFFPNCVEESVERGKKQTFSQACRTRGWCETLCYFWVWLSSPSTTQNAAGAVMACMYYSFCGACCGSGEKNVLTYLGAACFHCIFADKHCVHNWCFSINQ